MYLRPIVLEPHIKVIGEFLALFLLLFEQKRALITVSLIF